MSLTPVVDDHEDFLLLTDVCIQVNGKQSICVQALCTDMKVWFYFRTQLVCWSIIVWFYLNWKEKRSGNS